MSKKAAIGPVVPASPLAGPDRRPLSSWADFAGLDLVPLFSWSMPCAVRDRLLVWLQPVLNKKIEGTAQGPMGTLARANEHRLESSRGRTANGSLVGWFSYTIFELVSFVLADQ